jgi:hypothetical protein
MNGKHEWRKEEYDEEHTSMAMLLSRDRGDGDLPLPLRAAAARAASQRAAFAAQHWKRKRCAAVTLHRTGYSRSWIATAPINKAIKSNNPTPRPLQTPNSKLQTPKTPNKKKPSSPLPGGISYFGAGAVGWLGAGRWAAVGVGG